MFKEMIALLSKSGKRSLITSSLFFALYGIISAGMIVIVFSTLSMIAGRQSITAQTPYFAGLGLLVVIRGLCNMAADKEKHNAGFDIVQQIRERIERQGHKDPLELAARQRPEAAIREMRRPYSLQPAPHPVPQMARRKKPHRAAGQSGHEKIHDRRRGADVKPQILRHITDDRMSRMRALGIRIMKRAGMRYFAQNRAQKRRFSPTVRSHNHRKLPAVNM